MTVLDTIRHYRASQNSAPFHLLVRARDEILLCRKKNFIHTKIILQERRRQDRTTQNFHPSPMSVIGIKAKHYTAESKTTKKTVTRHSKTVTHHTVYRCRRELRIKPNHSIQNSMLQNSIGQDISILTHANKHDKYS